MRTVLFLALLLALLLPSGAQSRDQTDVDSSGYEPLGTALVKSWDCEATMLDTRSKKGVGFAACLRGLAMDTTSGRSTVVLEVTLDRAATPRSAWGRAAPR